MSISKLKKGDEVLIDSVESAFSLSARMCGLLGRDKLPSGQALHIKPCGSIHTFGMKFTLDLIFLDRNYHVVNIVRDVAPSRMVLGGKKAASVIELESGWFDWGKLSINDGLSIVNSDRNLKGH